MSGLVSVLARLRCRSSLRFLAGIAKLYPLASFFPYFQFEGVDVGVDEGEHRKAECAGGSC